MNHQQVRDFFAVNHTRPKKQLGQNFLVNPEILKIILEAGELTDTDTVIEIGAGLGCLTEAVARHAERVIAVEIDELLYKALEARFSMDSRVQLLNSDILKLELEFLLSDGLWNESTTCYGTQSRILVVRYYLLRHTECAYYLLRHTECAYYLLRHTECAYYF